MTIWFNLRYKMRLGTANLNTGFNTDTEEERKIKEVLSHPLHRSNQVYYNVGLAIADRRIDFTDYVRPICLPFQSTHNPDDLAYSSVTLAGWGHNTGFTTNKLNVRNLRVNPTVYCNETFSSSNLRAIGIPPLKFRQQMPRGFQSDVVCAGGGLTGDGACHGDSGAPAIRLRSGQTFYYEQALIVSAGLSCLMDTFFIRVADPQVLSWIKQETQN